MNTYSPAEFPPAEGLKIRVVDQGQVITLDFQEAAEIHQRALWWGAAVGYRAMQVAARALSRESLWSRDHLAVVSAHPGEGVLDSLNYVTRCAERKTLTVMEDAHCVSRCNSKMKFEWWVSHRGECAHVMLREDFVPADFYALIDRRVYNENNEADERLFELYKVKLSARIWVESLESTFSVEMLPPMAPGELPRNHSWSAATV